ncbi:hypothetical protein SDC9_132004 [bioreactor metagenome]|uniref:Uncharacterized protein n=1 Tax=bioreactor metagenome TaxID=1076179 RepID=A0A645D793_9ZZZZ
MILWFISVFFLLCAITLSFASLLSAAMMLACAVLLNPIFIKKIELKKGLTALLVIGLFIGAFAVFPTDQNEPEAKQALQESTSLETESEKDTEPDIQQTPKRVATPTLIPTITPVPTPTRMPTSTPTPTSSPTPRPTATTLLLAVPSPTPLSKQIKASGIEIVEYTDVIGRGEYASIEIKGEPNTTYHCIVDYKSGPSKAKGLGDQDSDGEGYVEWEWKVGTNTSLDYRPTITVSGGGDSVSVRFKVVE